MNANSFRNVSHVTTRKSSGSLANSFGPILYRNLIGRFC